MIAFFKMPGARTIYQAIYERGVNGPTLQAVYSEGDALSNLLMPEHQPIMSGLVEAATDAAIGVERSIALDLADDADTDCLRGN